MIAVAAIVATLAWLLAADVITKPLRDRIPTGFARQALNCARCTSFWVAALVVPVAALVADMSWLSAIGGGALGTLAAWLMVAIDDALIHLATIAERD